MCLYDRLHKISVKREGEADLEVDEIISDLVAVESSVHQSMVIVGPWFEGRISAIIRACLPSGWTTSGPAQIFDPSRPGVRSRSWDIVVHKKSLRGLPPEASPGAGHPLLPKSAVAAVIDTKTSFSTPKAYASQPLFNLMNDSNEPQFTLLGNGIRKIVLAARSERSPESLKREGMEVGLEVYCLARIRSEPVSKGVDREIQCILAPRDGQPSAIERFRRAILEAIEGHEDNFNGRSCCD